MTIIGKGRKEMYVCNNIIFVATIQLVKESDRGFRTSTVLPLLAGHILFVVILTVLRTWLASWVLCFRKDSSEQRIRLTEWEDLFGNGWEKNVLCMQRDLIDWRPCWRRAPFLPCLAWMHPQRVCVCSERPSLSQRNRRLFLGSLRRERFYRERKREREWQTVMFLGATAR